MTTPMLHVRGQVLLGPDEVRDELWVVGGRITYDPPSAGADVETVTGWVLPGLVDAHCHVGLDAHGAVDEATSEQQALRDRDAGTLLHPRRRLAGRHPLGRRPRGPAPHRPRRAAHRPHPPLHPQLRARDRAGGPVGLRAAGGPPRRRLGQAGRRLDRPGHRRPGALLAAGGASRRRSPRRTPRAPGSPPTASARSRCATSPPPGIDCIEHATGLTDDTIDAFAEQGMAIVPTLVNIDTFPAIAGAAAGQVPGLRRAHARPARPPLRDGRGRPRRRRADLPRHRRRRLAAARPGRGGGGRAGQGGSVRSPRSWTPPPGEPAGGWAGPGWSRARAPTWSSTGTTPQGHRRAGCAPSHVVLRGRVAA